MRRVLKISVCACVTESWEEIGPDTGLAGDADRAMMMINPRTTLL